MQNGLTDATAHLRAYLAPEIRTMGQGYQVDAVNDLRVEVMARVRAYCQVRPPRLEGVTALLGDVDVYAPDSLVDHAQALRDQRRLEELERRRKDFTREQAGLYEEIRVSVDTERQRSQGAIAPLERFSALQAMVSRSPFLRVSEWLIRLFFITHAGRAACGRVGGAAPAGQHR